MSHDRTPSRSSSRNLIRFQKLGSSEGIVWYVPVCRVDTGPRSFHSWHATSHALQPMQVVVSMNFETTGSWRIPVAPPERDAEERRISRLWAAMAVLLRLLELDEEGLVLRRPGVRVTGGRRQQVGQRPGVAGLARKAPVDGEADLPQLLAVD